MTRIKSHSSVSEYDSVVLSFLPSTSGYVNGDDRTTFAVLVPRNFGCLLFYGRLPQVPYRWAWGTVFMATRMRFLSIFRGAAIFWICFRAKVVRDI